jgi:large subunit ribosomal protein L10
MTREEKAVIIGELTQKFNENPFFYITDTSDLTVAEVMHCAGCVSKEV